MKTTIHRCARVGVAPPVSSVQHYGQGGGLIPSHHWFKGFCPLPRVSLLAKYCNSITLFLKPPIFADWRKNVNIQEFKF